MNLELICMIGTGMLCVGSTLSILGFFASIAETDIFPKRIKRFFNREWLALLLILGTIGACIASFPVYNFLYSHLENLLR